MIVNFVLQIYGLKDVKRTGWNFNPSAHPATKWVLGFTETLMGWLYAVMVAVAMKIEEFVASARGEQYLVQPVRAVRQPESVAAHSWSVTVLSLLLAEGREDLCLTKAGYFPLIHDDAEVKTGDEVVAHLSGDALAEARKRKRALEDKAIEELASLLPHDLERKYLMAHADYESRCSREAAFVKQIDGLDPLIQAIIYAKRGERAYPREFLGTVRPTIKDDELKIVLEILEEMVEELEKREGG
jgi:putative hydrolase of HD superfamily